MFLVIDTSTIFVNETNQLYLLPKLKTDNDLMDNSNHNINSDDTSHELNHAIQEVISTRMEGIKKGKKVDKKKQVTKHLHKKSIVETAKIRRELILFAILCLSVFSLSILIINTIANETDNVIPKDESTIAAEPVPEVSVQAKGTKGTKEQRGRAPAFGKGQSNSLEDKITD